jgi:hypothetical protein
MAAPEEKRQKVAEKLNADMIKDVDKILQSSKAQKVLRGKELMIRMQQETFVLDSIGADQIIKDVWLSRLVYSLIDETHTAVLPIVIDTLKALVKNHFGIERKEKANNYYFAIENREFDKLVLKSSDNLADLSEGEALLKKILEPYKGKFVLIDRHMVQTLQGSPQPLYRGVRPPERLRHPIPLSRQRESADRMGECHQGV